MKKFLLSAAVTIYTVSAIAQSLPEGIKMYNYERYKSAIRNLQPLAISNPMANYYYGLAQLYRGDVNDAKNTFSKYPEDIANISGMARVAFMQNNIAQGMQLAQSIAAKARKKDWEPFKYAADAITYTDGGDYQQAIDWYKKALSITDNSDLHLGLGDAYRKIQGGGGEAMNNYEGVTSKDPKNSLAYSKIGLLWYDAKNYQQALDNYEKAKQTDSLNPLPYRDLARAYARNGKYDQALQNIQKYITLSDSSTDDMIEYMDILYGSKHFTEAINLANELIRSGIVKPRFYAILAYSEYEIKDSVNALKHVRMFFAQQDTKKLLPGDYMYYAKIMMLNHMSDSADYYFNKSLSADTSKDKSDTYRSIAEAFKSEKEWGKSGDWYSKLVTEYPESAPIDYYWCTVMYYYGREYAKGAAVAEKFEAKYADQPSATYWRARNAAAIDSEAKSGDAVPYFTKWIDKVGTNTDKKNDLKTAYEYLLLYYYNKEDKDNIKKYIDLIDQIDPNDGLKKQIEEIEKQPKGGTKPQGKTPPKGKTPAKGK
jgi:tetratricopeptide (TPR) repeat protein